MSAIVVPLGIGTSHDWSQDHVFVKAPMHLTHGRVTVVEDALKPGLHLTRHHHRRLVETFYILDGDVTFTFDDGTTGAGRRSHLRADQPRSSQNQPCQPSQTPDPRVPRFL